MESMYWADQIARKIMEKCGKKCTIASGITPSGTIHFGNFREVITTDLIGRALEDNSVKVRFIYSWDDFDRFRKVPKNMPKQEILKKELGKPVSSVANVFGTKHKSYAEYLESEFEDDIKQVGVYPEFIRQSIMNKKCAYAKGIKTALRKRKKIAEILDKYRKEPLAKDWLPIEIYCEKCNRDFTKINSWDKDYSITYSCKCGYKNTFDFRKKGIIKLFWKVDWPMRWSYENVNFEPGGKDHSTYGSSYTVGKEIVKIFNWTAPDYVGYDFINIKGQTGKMSSSKGNTQSLNDVLKFYIPELIRYTFAGRTPKTEIFYSMDEGIFKHYADFYYTERIYFGKEKVPEKEKLQRKRIYEMSVVDKIPKCLPVQPSFKHCVELMNIYQGNLKGALAKIDVKKKSDINRYSAVLERAWNWINEFADEKYVFKINSKAPNIKVSTAKEKALQQLSSKLTKCVNEEDVTRVIRQAVEDNGVKAKEFYQLIYQILINKKAGPRLAPFILAIGCEKVRALLK